jgi:hypothetical protein
MIFDKVRLMTSKCMCKESFAEDGPDPSSEWPSPIAMNVLI